ncbi:hypothetical protein DFJ73DRAFT_793902 [Zopfochytrium polystomum]|nr:hypothetical protein DFJ73DRAFT_793902 [Zopfochytrium polystomum]
MAPHIVVLGGSLAGVNVIKRLEKAIGSSANITLIEERDHFYIPYAALRSVVDPKFANTIWVPYTSLFKNLPNGKVVQARAVAIHEKQVVLANGSAIDFDYLVIATGSKMPAPGKTQKVTKAEGIKESTAVYNALKSAKRVAIVGGGSVGIELAGELTTDMPHLQVDLITSGATVLDGAPKILPTMINATTARLAKIPNLKVHTGHRVSGGITADLAENGYTLAPTTLTSDTGLSVSADVAFLATGIARPNSDAAAALGQGVLDARGYVLTTKTGQLPAFPHIFAAGDVAALDEIKTGMLAQKQATLVADNLAALVKGGKATKEYAAATDAMMVLPIGRNGGTAQMPFGFIMGDRTAKMIKSGTLFVPMMWGPAEREGSGGLKRAE